MTEGLSKTALDIISCMVPGPLPGFDGIVEHHRVSSDGRSGDSFGRETLRHSGDYNWYRDCWDKRYVEPSGEYLLGLEARLTKCVYDKELGTLDWSCVYEPK